MEFWNNPVELARVLGIIVPLVVALITSRYADSAVKSFLLVALTAVSGAVAYLVGADGGWDWGGFFNAWFNAFLAGIVAYYGALKPLGITPAVADSTGTFGITTLGFVGTSRDEGGFTMAPKLLALIVIVACVAITLAVIFSD